MRDFFDFIKYSPTAFHAVKSVQNILSSYDFIEIKKNTKIEANQKYYIIKNDSSLFAFTTPKDLSDVAIKIVASHSDSPSFKLKPQTMIRNANYTKLNIEPYGGAIYSTWMDRKLGIAGRVFYANENKIYSKLIDLDELNIVIPNLPIHFNREVNHGVNLNPQVDMLPIFGDENADLERYIKLKTNIDSKIIAHDLFLYNKEEGSEVGDMSQYYIAPRIDDLGCVYTSMAAFVCSQNTRDINMFVVFNNEEVGSMSTNGAASTILIDLIEEIIASLKITNKRAVFEQSIMISADNGHAIHPNHPEISDSINNVKLNEGIVIKYNSNLNYTTDAQSSAIFKTILEKGKIPYQEFTNRSDIRGGGTLGAISLSQLSITSIDIGLAQLAMHSSMEMGGCQDLKYMISGLTEFYNSTVRKNETEVIIIK